MAGRFDATIVIDRPIEEVFDFLADGENDKKFSSRIVEIAKTTDGPPGVGTVYASTAKDAGVKMKHEFELTAFDRPTRIRWTELTKHPLVVAEGGYDLAPEGERTRLRFFNELEGRGIGVLLVGLALRAARKGADDFAESIKAAVEAG
jgi:uncharacterized protein YndB with AHSA1/START domain